MVQNLLVKNYMGDGNGAKKIEGGLLTFFPWKEGGGGLEDDLCYKGNKYKLSAQ